MHSRAQFFFLSRKRGGTIFPLCSHQVPTGFPTCSQHVPNSTLLYPISFAFSSDLVTDITRSKQGHYSICALGMSHLLHLWVFVMRQSMMPITKKIKWNLGVPTTR
jgi:hypothetical protein